MAAVASLKSKRNYDTLRRSNQGRLKKINDVYIDAQLAIGGLELLAAEIATGGTWKRKGTGFALVVPSTKEARFSTITRKPEAIDQLIRARINSKEYMQSLVFAISLTEDYIADVLTLVMEAYPKKILISTKGNKVPDAQTMSVPLVEIINANSLDSILVERAAQRARDALYATPQQYGEYMEAVLGFGLSSAVQDRYIESKATRDLYVHGNGVVNRIYISKVGEHARAKVGQVVPLDQAYLEDSIGNMKQMFSALYKGMLDKYGDSQEIERAFSNRAARLGETVSTS